MRTHKEWVDEGDKRGYSYIMMVHGTKAYQRATDFAGFMEDLLRMSRVFRYNVGSGIGNSGSIVVEQYYQSVQVRLIGGGGCGSGS